MCLYPYVVARQQLGKPDAASEEEYSGDIFRNVGNKIWRFFPQVVSLLSLF
jgi:hypothetical protein